MPASAGKFEEESSVTLFVNTPSDIEISPNLFFFPLVS
jgi:hypothetical protein